MNKRLALFLLIALLMLTGCSPAAATSAPMQQAPAMPAEANRASSAGGASDSTTNKAAPQAPAADISGQAAAPDTRLVIRNANLTIIVDNPGSAMSAISAMAEKMGGFVVASNLYKTTTRKGDEVPEGNITVRVPVAKLDDALAQVKGLVKDQGKDVQSETISGQDVTKEYTDLQSQLTNLQNAEAQLREIMASATKTEDVLSVYNQLTQIRGQIEVIKGQIQYYRDSAAMSAIAVQIRAQAAVQPLEIAGWEPVGVARDAAQTLIDTMQFLGSAAIWLIIFVLPVGLVIFLPLRFLWWLLRRNRKKPSLPAPTPPATAG